MAKLKDYHWVSEDRKEFTKWNEEALFSKLDIQSRRVFFECSKAMEGTVVVLPKLLNPTAYLNMWKEPLRGYLELPQSKEL